MPSQYAHHSVCSPPCLARHVVSQKDNPLRLRSTMAWLTEEMRIWDIVAELVDICTVPAPTNPFAIDLDFFTTLPLFESIAATGSMIDILNRALEGRIHRYDALLRTDIEALSALHFQDMAELHAILRLGAEPSRPMVTVGVLDEDLYVLPE